MRGRAAWLGLAVMTAMIGIALVGCASAPSGSPAAGKSQTDLLTGCRVQSAHGAKLPNIRPI